MQPTRKDVIKFLNQVIMLAKEHNQVLNDWAEQEDPPIDTIAEWYCSKLNITMPYLCSIKEAIALPFNIVDIEYLHQNAEEMLQDVMSYDEGTYNEILSSPFYSY